MIELSMFEFVGLLGLCFAGGVIWVGLWVVILDLYDWWGRKLK